MTWLLISSFMGWSRQSKMVKKSALGINQNARKGGFYSQALNEAERLAFEKARGMEGLDEEIAVLRVKLQELLESQPDRFDLHIKVANTIARLVGIRYNITREQKKSLKEAVNKVLTEVAIPLGIKTFTND